MDAKSDEVKYILCLYLCGCVALDKNYPVAKRSEYNVYGMTFALPEEYSVSVSYSVAFSVAWRKMM